MITQWEYKFDVITDDESIGDSLEVNGVLGWELVAVAEVHWKSDNGAGYMSTHHATTTLYYKRPKL